MVQVNRLFTPILFVLFFKVGLFSGSSTEEHIKAIRKEFYRINKLSLKKYLFSMGPQDSQWKPGRHPSAQLSAIIYTDKNKRIKKFSSSADSGNVFTEIDEYFWDDGQLFFVFFKEEYFTDVRHRTEVRLYFWKNELIRNLASELIFDTNGKNTGNKKVKFDPDLSRFHKQTKELQKKFNFK